VPDGVTYDKALTLTMKSALTNVLQSVVKQQTETRKLQEIMATF